MPKSIRLNSTHYVIMEIPNKRELQQIAFNQSLVIDAALASDNTLRFRKNLIFFLSERI